MALRYATISIVFSGKSDLPITLGFIVNYVDQSRKEVVTKLLDQIKDFPIKIDWLLLDGGFASVEVLEELDERELKWIVRGRHSKKKEYLGDSGESFPYDLKDNYRVEGYLIDHKTPKGEKEQVLLLSSKKWTVDVETAKELYRKRFRIENTYRSARGAKIRTTTRKTRLRWVLWAVSHYLEILWNLMRHIHQIQGMDLYMARQKQFMRILNEVISDNLLLELTRDRLIDQGVG